MIQHICIWLLKLGQEVSGEESLLQNFLCEGQTGQGSDSLAILIQNFRKSRKRQNKKRSDYDDRRMTYDRRSRFTKHPRILGINKYDEQAIQTLKQIANMYYTKMLAK